MRFPFPSFDRKNLSLFVSRVLALLGVVRRQNSIRIAQAAFAQE
jgi:hypothetical protein